MNPIKLEGSKVFGKPRDWDPEVDGECIGLPVIMNGHSHISVWKPTALERANIAKGYNIALTCAGGQPPVLLMAVDVDGDIVRFTGDEDELPEPVVAVGLVDQIFDYWLSWLKPLAPLASAVRA